LQVTDDVSFISAFRFLTKRLILFLFPLVLFFYRFKVEVVDNRERERKLRREIANSNERRRMQSINSGFQALRLLIPHSEGEKLSKVNFHTYKVD
jgi:hypothetical protein